MSALEKLRKFKRDEMSNYAGGPTNYMLDKTKEKAGLKTEAELAKLFRVTEEKLASWRSLKGA
jgi:hypothetical protein